MPKKSSSERRIELHHLNKNPFVRHTKDAVPCSPKRYLGAWESLSSEWGEALGVQLVSASLLGQRNSASASLPLLRAS